MVVLRKRTNLQGSVWSLLFQKKASQSHRGKRIQFSYSLQSVHTFIPLPQAMKIPDAQAAVNKEWEKLEKIPAWQMDKVKSKKDATLEAQNEEKKVHFACHLKNAELEPKHQQYKGRVVLRGDSKNWSRCIHGIHRTTAYGRIIADSS